MKVLQTLSRCYLCSTFPYRLHLSVNIHSSENKMKSIPAMFLQQKHNVHTLLLSQKNKKKNKEVLYVSGVINGDGMGVACVVLSKV